MGGELLGEKILFTVQACDIIILQVLPRSGPTIQDVCIYISVKSPAGASAFLYTSLGTSHGF